MENRFEHIGWGQTAATLTTTPAKEFSCDREEMYGKQHQGKICPEEIPRVGLGVWAGQDGKETAVPRLQTRRGPEAWLAAGEGGSA